MNDEIKVNDYVRTKDDYIAKVTRLETANMIFCDNTVRECWVGEVKHILTENIIKHSPNIIDLVEVGDYVNGSLVIETLKNDKSIIIEDYCETQLFNKDIKTVVTKEQFEKIMYRVEE